MSSYVNVLSCVHQRLMKKKTTAKFGPDPSLDLGLRGHGVVKIMSASKFGINIRSIKGGAGQVQVADVMSAAYCFTNKVYWNFK